MICAVKNQTNTDWLPVGDSHPLSSSHPALPCTSQPWISPLQVSCALCVSGISWPTYSNTYSSFFALKHCDCVETGVCKNACLPMLVILVYRSMWDLMHSSMQCLPAYAHTWILVYCACLLLHIAGFWYTMTAYFCILLDFGMYTVWTLTMSAYSWIHLFSCHDNGFRLDLPLH